MTPVVAILVLAVGGGAIALHEAPCHELSVQKVRHADLSRHYRDRIYWVSGDVCRLHGMNLREPALMPAVDVSGSGQHRLMHAQQPARGGRP